MWKPVLGVPVTIEEIILLQIGSMVEQKSDECVFSLFLEFPEFKDWYNKKKNERTKDSSKCNTGPYELRQS